LTEPAHPLIARYGAHFVLFLPLIDGRPVAADVALRHAVRTGGTLGTFPSLGDALRVLDRLRQEAAFAELATAAADDAASARERRELPAGSL
jgi:hypothetical protein